MIISAFDFETKSLDSEHQEYALQPWRPEFDITSLAICYYDMEKEKFWSDVMIAKQGMIEFLNHAITVSQIIFCHNAMFDLSCLRGAAFTSYPKNKLVDFDGKLLDTLLLAKWGKTINVKSKKSFSLKNVAGMLFKENQLIAGTGYTFADWETMKLNEIKNNFQTKETSIYNALDAYMCLLVGWKFLGEFTRADRLSDRQAILSAKQITSIFTESACLVPAVDSYLRGITLDSKLIEELKIEFKEKLKLIETDLQLSATILASPKQLSNLVYNEWHIPPDILSDKTGMPSTSKAALKSIDDVRVQKILEWKETKTLLDKFVLSSLDSIDYCNRKIITHPQPTIFGTYTGRMTYSSKTLHKFPSGIAIHQIPRNKRVRSIIVPPPGSKLVEIDASTQEIRLLAHLSRDKTLIKLLNENKDIHSYTGSVLAGIPYDEFMKRYSEGDPTIAGVQGLRYCGKFINLSCQYRIGKNKLAMHAKIDYGLNLSIEDAQRFKDTYIKAYPGVKDYWNRLTKQARSSGFVETLGGRTIELNYLDKNFSMWDLDSTAINFPIQGTGADMKEIALEFLTDNFKKLRFYFDLHDGLWFYVNKDLADDYLIAAKEGLENMDLYERPWNTKLDVPLLWEISVGDAMGNMSKLEG